jgi:phage tail protein X
VPRAESIPTLVEIRTTQGDRLDLIAYRTLGDPEQFWRICDANNILDPSDLTREVNTLVRIGIPQPGT